MAAVLPKSVFIHIPKTGGTTCRQAFYDSHLLKGEIKNCHATLGEIRGELHGRPTFACVREPVSWYRSFWAHRRLRRDRPGHKNHPESAMYVFEPREEEPFAEWVSRMTEDNPGGLTWFYKHFIGWPVQVDAVMRHDSLLRDLATVLNKFGESFRLHTLLSTPTSRRMPADVSNECIVTYDIRRRIWKSEMEIYRRFFRNK